MTIPSIVQEFSASEYIKDSNKITYGEDLEKAYAIFTKNPTKTLTFFPLRHDGSIFHLIIEGTVQSNGIIQNETYLTHAFCFEPIDPNETKSLEDLGDEVFKRYPWIMEDFEYTSMVKKDKLWIKCKVQNGAYTFKHPFTTHLKKTLNFPITADQPLRLTTKLSAYVDWEKKTYGCCLNLLKIDLVN